MIDDEPTVSFAADVYSYGIILWQIHTREIPFQNLKPIVIMRQVADKQVRPVVPGDSPLEYAELMKKCWKHLGPFIK